MRFWDASAIVPLLVREERTEATLDAYRADPHLLVWWGTEVECVSAVARREREGALSAEVARDVLRRFDDLARSWSEIQPVREVREHARRFLRLHPLRATDALQLSAAFVAAERRPASLPFVCLDRRLATCASREGFDVLVPA